MSYKQESQLQRIFRWFVEAVKRFYNQDKAVVNNNSNERCMAARIFHYYATKVESSHRKPDEFCDISVDYEYNRVGEEPKALSEFSQLRKSYCDNNKRDEYTDEKRNEYSENTDKTHEGRFIPDLVVHKRNSPEQNALVVEFKKIGCDIGLDAIKLRLLTSERYKDDFNYKIGASVVLGKDFDTTTCQLFVNEKEIKERFKIEEYDVYLNAALMELGILK